MVCYSRPVVFCSTFDCFDFGCFGFDLVDFTMFVCLNLIVG